MFGASSDWLGYRLCLQAHFGRFSGAPYVTLFGTLAGNLNRYRASQAAGFAAVTIAAAALISWWVSVPLPSSWASGFATVKPTTALCLAVLGLAVVYPGTASRFVFAVGLAVAAVAALDLLDLFSIDSGINRLNRLLVPQAAVPEPENKRGAPDARTPRRLACARLL
jgi:hypothetical protein